jgi:hypothetical protein
MSSQKRDMVANLIKKDICFAVCREEFNLIASESFAQSYFIIALRSDLSKHNIRSQMSEDNSNLGIIEMTENDYLGFKEYRKFFQKLPALQVWELKSKSFKSHYQRKIKENVEAVTKSVPTHTRFR